MTADHEEERFEVSKEFVEWIYYTIFLIFVMAAIGFSMRIGLARSVDTSDAVVDVISNRILFDTDCYAYEKNGRSYFGVIDLNKFKTNKDCFLREGYSALINLKIDGEEFLQYNNKDEYLVNSKFCYNQDRFVCKSITKNLAVNADDENKFGTVEINAVFQKDK